MLLDGRLLRERPGQHELGFEDGPAGIDHPVQGGRHPFDDRMLDPPLHVLDGMTGVALVPRRLDTQTIEFWQANQKLLNWRERRG